jgi:hypothetical protein
LITTRSTALLYYAISIIRITSEMPFKAENIADTRHAIR